MENLRDRSDRQGVTRKGRQALLDEGVHVLSVLVSAVLRPAVPSGGEYSRCLRSLAP